MTAKLWIYIFTLVGAIIQISLQTYDKIPDDNIVIWFTIAGSITITLATICKNRIKSFGEDFTIFLFVVLVIYLFSHDYAIIFKQFGQYWFYLIAVIVAHRTYAESKETHRKNLIQYSDTLLKIIISYNSSEIKTNVVRDSLVFQTWLRDMNKAQKDLRKELYEGNRVSDFSFKEWWFERKRFINNNLPQRVTNQHIIPFEKYTLHETVKLAEEVVRCHSIFLESFRDLKEDKFITYTEKVVLVNKTASDLQKILEDIRKRYDGPYDVYNHHLTERLHDNEEVLALQN